MNILNGITSSRIKTDRIEFHVLTAGKEDAIPVVFLHGNFSSATFWEEIMLHLPTKFRAIAPDLRGYGWTEDKIIDATKGMQDWVDDLDDLFKVMNIDKTHLVGWSLGCGIIFKYIIDHPDKVLSVTLESPVSPYGFGGTKGLEGTPCYDDFAGSGGGTVNPEFVKRIISGDRSAEDPNSPRNVINTFYYKTPFKASREEDFLNAALQEKMGEQKYPGDMAKSDNWPNIAPGKYGPINAGSPKYLLNDVSKLIQVNPKPPILWIRGSDDMIVGDNSMFDFGTLGKLGYVPGWPGESIFPPQPMVSQTRHVLELYKEKGGSFKEHVIQDAAHGPHIEKSEEFNKLLHEFISKAT